MKFMKVAKDSFNMIHLKLRRINDTVQATAILQRDQKLDRDTKAISKKKKKKKIKINK